MLSSLPVLEVGCMADLLDDQLFQDLEPLLGLSEQAADSLLADICLPGQTTSVGPSIPCRAAETEQRRTPLPYPYTAGPPGAAGLQEPLSARVHRAHYPDSNKVHSARGTRAQNISRSLSGSEVASLSNYPPQQQRTAIRSLNMPDPLEELEAWDLQAPHLDTQWGPPQQEGSPQNARKRRHLASASAPLGGQGVRGEAGKGLRDSPCTSADKSNNTDSAGGLSSSGKSEGERPFATSLSSSTERPHLPAVQLPLNHSRFQVSQRSSGPAAKAPTTTFRVISGRLGDGELLRKAASPKEDDQRDKQLKKVQRAARLTRRQASKQEHSKGMTSEPIQTRIPTSAAAPSLQTPGDSRSAGNPCAEAGVHRETFEDQRRPVSARASQDAVPGLPGGQLHASRNVLARVEAVDTQLARGASRQLLGFLSRGTLREAVEEGVENVVSGLYSERARLAEQRTRLARQMQQLWLEQTSLQDREHRLMKMISRLTHVREGFGEQRSNEHLLLQLVQDINDLRSGTTGDPWARLGREFGRRCARAAPCQAWETTLRHGDNPTPLQTYQVVAGLSKSPLEASLCFTGGELAGKQGSLHQLMNLSCKAYAEICLNTQHALTRLIAQANQGSSTTQQKQEARQTVMQLMVEQITVTIAFAVGHPDRIYQVYQLADVPAETSTEFWPQVVASCEMSPSQKACFWKMWDARQAKLQAMAQAEQAVRRRLESLLAAAPQPQQDGQHLALLDTAAELKHGLDEQMLAALTMDSAITLTTWTPLQLAIMTANSAPYHFHHDALVATNAVPRPERMQEIA